MIDKNYFTITELEKWCNEQPGYKEYKEDREKYHLERAKSLGLTIEQYHKQANEQAREFCEKLEQLNDSSNISIST